jgi:hypothetical protein
LAWALNDQKRAALCFIVGLLLFSLGWLRGYGWEASFLAAWDVAVASYLALLGVVVFTATPPKTRARAGLVDRADLYLLAALILVITLVGDYSGGRGSRRYFDRRRPTLEPGEQAVGGIERRRRGLFMAAFAHSFRSTLREAVL